MGLAGGTRVIRNVIGNVPHDPQAELKVMVHSAYQSPNQEAAEMIAKDLLERYQDLFPSAMKSSHRRSGSLLVLHAALRRVIPIQHHHA